MAGGPYPTAGVAQVPTAAPQSTPDTTACPEPQPAIGVVLPLTDDSQPTAGVAHVLATPQSTPGTTACSELQPASDDRLHAVDATRPATVLNAPDKTSRGPMSAVARPEGNGVPAALCAAPETSLLLMPRSLLVFTDDAYRHATHGIDEVGGLERLI